MYERTSNQEEKAIFQKFRNLIVLLKQVAIVPNGISKNSNVVGLIYFWSTDNFGSHRFSMTNIQSIHKRVS